MIFFLLLINYPIASTVFCTYVKCAIRTSKRKHLTLGDPYARVVVVCVMFTAFFDLVSVHGTNDFQNRDPSVNYQSRQ
jgi:Na+-translocating ferredoxin:NAD+ oxidoreductase RnfD subunit